MPQNNLNFKYVTPTLLRFFTRYGKVIIPKGFMFDGMSCAPDICLPAACLHDWLYLVARIEGKKISRLQADICLYDSMRDFDLRFFSLAYFIGVRVGGMFAWNEHRRHDTEPDILQSYLLPNADKMTLDPAEWLLSNVNRKQLNKS